jgi:hypothetical protein
VVMLCELPALEPEVGELEVVEVLDPVESGC